LIEPTTGNNVVKRHLYPSHPQPASSYAEALDRLAVWQAKDTPEVQPVCHLQLLTHGHKVERAIVFFHGYTSCPHQFYPLGKLFHRRGYNVLIPRFPYHGLADVMTPTQAFLTAGTLTGLADEAIDITRGLGERISVMGLSMGGVVTAWVAQNRGDVDRAMIISPVFGVLAVPMRLTPLIVWMYMHLPNRFRWWDPNLKAKVPRPPYVYPRLATRTLSHILHLGFAVRAQARHNKPAARSVLMVTNANDLAVDNRAAAELAANWRRSGAANLHTCEFDARQQLNHDLIDPLQVGAKTGLVYPVLLDLMIEQKK
jgi:esterase/lipase